MYKQEEAQTAGQQSIMFSFCRKFCFLILLDVLFSSGDTNTTSSLGQLDISYNLQS